jgi:hypothetical protein
MQCWATDRSALPFKIRLVGGAKTERVFIYEEGSVRAGQTAIISTELLDYFRASLQSCLSVRTKKKIVSSWTDFRKILY